MYGFYNHIDKFRRYGGFNRTETLWLCISILVMGFLVGFDDGREVFEVGPWTAHMLLGIAAVTVAVLAREFMHRYWGLEGGYRTEFKPLYYGLIAGVIISFMSFGKLIFLSYGYFQLHTMEKHRLGYFRYHLGYFTMGKVAAYGPLANLVIAFVFKAMVFLPDIVIETFVLVNVLFAITNMLPIPLFDGGYLLYASRLLYFIFFGFTIISGIFLLYAEISVLYIVLAGAVGGLITILAFMRNIEPRIGADLK